MDSYRDATDTSPSHGIKKTNKKNMALKMNCSYGFCTLQTRAEAQKRL